jgi:predicted nucleic acid-binding protein
MKEVLKGSLACDAGALLELMLGTESGNALKLSLLSGEAEALATELAIAEVRYVLCRRYGKAVSDERVRALLDSGYLKVWSTDKLVDIAADYKCARSLSLPDCFTLALAARADVPALFAHRERELASEMSRKPFEIEIRFLQ